MQRSFTLFMLLALLCVASQLVAADAKPNVILIVIDDLGWADLGCYGSTFYKTPYLDRMAADGRRFTQGYAACPVCSPTRAAIMTGKAPARLHLTDWLPARGDMPSQKLLRPAIRQQLPLEEITLAETLKAAGYATGHIGKWHLGGEGFEPTKQGFDSNVAGNASGSPPTFFAPYSNRNRSIPDLDDAPKGEYLTDRLTREAEKFIDAHREGPFFLYLAHYAVHIPLTGKGELVDRFGAWDEKPHGKQENPVYAAMIASVDESIGRIFRKLKEHDLASETLVIFTSDNGGLATLEGPLTPATINTPLREGKGWLYEGGVRVPLIVHWPGRIAPGVEPTPAWSCDLAPTIAELCGTKQPSSLDGVSLAGLLRENKPLAPRALHWHYPHYANQGGRPGGLIREGDWKLIEFYENGRRELFDLAKDARESTNLADKHPDVVARLAGKLAEWRTSVDAQMPGSNPDYLPNPQAKDRTITLPARTAEVHGTMLRYEPLPHKNTLGFWVRADDWVSWEFEVREPGEFKLTALVGCGNGSGGSEVEFRVGKQKLAYTVAETGGFQQFVPRELGTVKLPAGRNLLEVRALKKPRAAVMDLREVKLVAIEN